MPDDSKETLSGAAVDTAVRELTAMAVIFLVSYAMLNRDSVLRLYRRLTEQRVTPEQAHASREVAELRRAISAYEHRGGA